MFLQNGSGGIKDVYHRSGTPFIPSSGGNDVSIPIETHPVYPSVRSKVV
jgi:hypothetical protein